jgi:hypothetical protein
MDEETVFQLYKALDTEKLERTMVELQKHIDFIVNELNVRRLRK